MGRRRNTIEDFWRRVDVRGAGECWEWQGSKHSFGYGQFSMGDKMMLAHRIACSTARDVPKGMHVLHKCDNPACCNPDHLFVGTHADNMRDKTKKGRQYKPQNPPVGEDASNTKLTESEAFFIRYSDMSNAELGRIFDITSVHVGHIKARKSWKHLP